MGLNVILLGDDVAPVGDLHTLNDPWQLVVRSRRRHVFCAPWTSMSAMASAALFEMHPSTGSPCAGSSAPAFWSRTRGWNTLTMSIMILRGRDATRWQPSSDFRLAVAAKNWDTSVSTAFIKSKREPSPSSRQWGKNWRYWMADKKASTAIFADSTRQRPKRPKRLSALNSHLPNLHGAI